MEGVNKIIYYKEQQAITIDNSFKNYCEGKQKIRKYLKMGGNRRIFWLKMKKLKNVCMLMIETDDQEKDEITGE